MKKKISLRARLINKMIFLFMEFPFMKGSTFLDLSIKLSQKKSVWKCPKNYELIKHTIECLDIEELVNNDSNSRKVILQFHGGAYLKKYYDIYRMLALRYSKISQGARVFSIDYRIAPEFTFPCALLDAQKAWDWILSLGYKEEDIIIAGDSAGGNLALSLVMKLRDQNKTLPAGMILMSPWADFSASGDSYIYNLKEDPIFGSRKNKIKPKIFDMEENLRLYAGNTELTNKYLSPIYGEYTNFPPMLIQVGTTELIESDSITIYEKAKNSQVNVSLSRYYGMFHDFQLFLDLIPESRLAWKEVENFINLHLLVEYEDESFD